MQLKGIRLNDKEVVLSDAGLPLVIFEPANPPEGYVADYKWVEQDGSLVKTWSFKPKDGTAEEAMLRLSKLQAQSLPDEYALEVSALFDEWEAGASYAEGQRVRFKGKLYKVLQAHVFQADWPPEAAPSLFAEVLPGQDGNEPEEGYAEWVQPDSTNPYSQGDKVLHGGRLWESTADGNVWEPGAVGAPWSDLGEA